MPSRWAVAAAGTTAQLNVLFPNQDDPTDTDPLWDHELGRWMVDMGALTALGAICGVIVARLLRRHEPEVMRK